MKNLYIFILSLSVISLCSAGTAGAQQTVTLEEAINIALNNRPKMKVAETTIENTRAGKGQSWQIGSTSFGYTQNVQPSAGNMDRELAISQSFGSLMTPFYNNALINKQVRTDELNYELVEREVIAEVKQAWVNYLYAATLCMVYQEQVDVAARLEKVCIDKYECGKINSLEKKQTTAHAAEMRNKLISAIESRNVAAEKLQWVTFSENMIIPEDSVITKITLSRLEPGLANVYTDYYASQVEEQAARINVAKSGFFPGLSAGYTINKIANPTDVNTFNVGLSIPIFFAPQRSQIRQAQFGKMIAEYNAEEQVKSLTNQVEEIIANIKRYEVSIDYYTVHSMPEADELLAETYRHMDEGDVPIQQYIQSFMTALNIRTGYLQELYNYNINVLKYELYR